MSETLEREAEEAWERYAGLPANWGDDAATKAEHDAFVAAYRIGRAATILHEAAEEAHR